MYIVHELPVNVEPVEGHVCEVALRVPYLSHPGTQMCIVHASPWPLDGIHMWRFINYCVCCNDRRTRRWAGTFVYDDGGSGWTCVGDQVDIFFL